jgi:hypothetical protein
VTLSKGRYVGRYGYMEIFGADKNRGQVTGRSKNQTSPYDRRDDCEPASVADVFRFRDQTSEGNPIAWCLRLHRNELNSHLCGLGPAMASAFDIASQFFSCILVEVLKNVAIRAARSSCQLNTFGKGIQIVNHFGLTWLLTPVFLRSWPTTHADTIPKA